MNRRCQLTLAIASLALMLASPLVAGQGLTPNPTPPFTLSASPAALSVFPGEAATYTITIGNDAPILDRTASLKVTALPSYWTYSFTPDPVNVTHQSNATTSLSVFVPNSTAPQTVTVTYEANDTFGFTRANVSLTVKARPTATLDSAPPAAPRLLLSVTPRSSGDSGTTLQGTVRIQHDDPTRSTLAVQLSASAPAGWNAYLKPADQNRNLAAGQTADVPVFVDVPALADNTTVNVTVLATLGETVYSARWSVTGLAIASDPSTDTPSSTSASDPTSEATTARAPRAIGPNFELRVLPLELDIASGAAETATVRVTNTGSTTLTISLSALPPASWRPIEFERKEITLAAGELRDISITLTAPDDIPAGGRADVAVSGVAAGIVRRGDLVLHIVPAASPRDETATNAATTNAPSTVDSGLPSVGAPVLIAVGLAAAGSTALVLVNRPLREKLLWGAAGLYTRLARPDVLGHEDREKLYKLIETQPSIHFHALQRDLGWNTGTLTYHVRVLEKHGFVVSRRDGLYRRFYLAGAAPRKEVFENQGPTGLRADVMEAIRTQPGISQSDLSLGLGANKQTVNYHVKALERAGTIRVEKRGRDTFLYAGDAPSTAEPGSAHA